MANKKPPRKRAKPPSQRRKAAAKTPAAEAPPPQDKFILVREIALQQIVSDLGNIALKVGGLVQLLQSNSIDPELAAQANLAGKGGK